MERNTFKKAQYGKAMDIWREKAKHDYKVYCDENEVKPQVNEWNDLLYTIASYKLLAYSAGIDGLAEPSIIDKLDEVSEGEPPIGIEFFNTIRDMIHNSFMDGQNARE